MNCSVYIDLQRAAADRPKLLRRQQRHAPTPRGAAADRKTRDVGWPQSYEGTAPFLDTAPNRARCVGGAPSRQKRATGTIANLARSRLTLRAITLSSGAVVCADSAPQETSLHSHRFGAPCRARSVGLVFSSLPSCPVDGIPACDVPSCSTRLEAIGTDDPGHGWSLGSMSGVGQRHQTHASKRA